MNPKRKLPIGIRIFRTIREEGCYYVNKIACVGRLDMTVPSRRTRVTAGPGGRRICGGVQGWEDRPGEAGPGTSAGARSDGGAGLKGGRSRNEIDEMGAAHVDVTIRNPAEPERSWKRPFPVDTGALDSLVPGSRLEAIGIEPEGQRVCELADGSEIEMDVAVARIEFISTC